MKVWDVDDPKALGAKVYDADTGAEVRSVFRVCFDGDGDEGPAVVRRYLTDDAGNVVGGRLPASAHRRRLPIDADGYPFTHTLVTERRNVRVVGREPVCDTFVEVRSDG